MSRQEYLEERLEELEDRAAADARCLRDITRNVEKRYTSGTRDSIIKVAIHLHDTRVELQIVREELRQRAQIEAQRLKLLGAE